jgi:hypothetical protein
MARARDEGAFPVRYFWECEPVAPVQAEQAQAEPSDPILATWPERIWLQWNPDEREEYPGASEGLTWCADNIHKTDVGYVRADLAAPALPAQAEQVAAVRAAYEKAAMVCQNMYEDGEGGAACSVAADRIRFLATKEAAAVEAPSQPQIDAVMAAIQHACGALPVGYEVILEMENGAGCVVWIDDENERHVIDGEGYITQDIYEAVEKAQAHAAQQSPQSDMGGDRV